MHEQDLEPRVATLSTAQAREALHRDRGVLVVQGGDARFVRRAGGANVPLAFSPSTDLALLQFVVSLSGLR